VRQISSDQYYTQLGPSYREVALKRSDYNRAVDSLVAQLAQNKKDSSWLDIGTGNGDRLLQLLKIIGTAPSVICLEPSKFMYEEAQKKLGSNALVINSALDAYSDEERKKFSMVTALWNVIGHTDNPVKFVEDAYAMLDQDGFLLFDANNRYNIREYGIFAVMRNAISDILGLDTKGLFKLRTNDANEFTNVYIASPNEIRRACRMLDGAKHNIYFIDYRTGKPTNCLGGQMVVSISRGVAPC
jgi:SAM-dependent methyltransferase